MSDLVEFLRNSSQAERELTSGRVAWHLIQEWARTAVFENEVSLNYNEAWDIVNSSDYDVPDLEDLEITSGSVQDAVVAVAQRSQLIKDLEEMETDVSRLEDIYDELESEGYEVDRMEFGSCTLGWLPHKSEKDWYDGTVMYHWSDVEGSGPRDVLLVPGFDDRLWLYVKKEEEENV